MKVPNILSPKELNMKKKNNYARQDQEIGSAIITHDYDSMQTYNPNPLNKKHISTPRKIKQELEQTSPSPKKRVLPGKKIFEIKKEYHDYDHDAAGDLFSFGQNNIQIDPTKLRRIKQEDIINPEQNEANDIQMHEDTWFAPAIKQEQEVKTKKLQMIHIDEIYFSLGRNKMRVVVGTKRADEDIKLKRMDLDELGNGESWIFIDYIKKVYSD